MSNTKAIGDIGEQIAVEYLEKAGYTILERNAKYCGCEADIICSCYTDNEGNVVRPKDMKGHFKSLFGKRKVADLQNTHIDGNLNRVTVFCEVKTRNGSEFGDGAEAVTPYKVGRYITLAKAYMTAHLSFDEDIRFDIIEVCGDSVNHIVNAFTADDARYYRR